VRTIDRIVRSVQAFGREFKRPLPGQGATASPTIGIALGGGFARGIAHIGALKVLEEERVPIHCVAGTSVGALIGACYCSGLCASDLEAVARRVRFRDFARWTVSRYGFATNERMIRFLDSFLKGREFEDLALPFAVTATDFASGEGVVFRSGPVIDAVRASCAYPGMFLPVNIGGRLLVDGMLSHPVPAGPAAEMGATHVIAISLKGHWSAGGAPRHVFDVIGQCFAIAQESYSQRWRKAAALVVEPDVSGFGYDDFSRTPELLEAGETAMRAALPEIRKWLSAAAPSARPATAPRSRLSIPGIQYPAASSELSDQSQAV
jgi:NTE family protein